ncbi:radical SAM family heme chaperone HemW [Terriglobus albidus]|uniref:Heme chaperone HemW n=1 Tax=Terriglobus albidus TaxID=1592106 RepID=A0A5B9E8E8_9BACT|nr:radical SAM family heme chaperone HemW [Terriglobus albidus]QEE28512.1 radical SAM family heme chaperone HemW [Terriglobus albidus]
MSPAGLYLSVPFCRAKCSYCNFASDAFGPARMDAYVDRLCEEIAQAPAKASGMGATLPRDVDSVYFGGGTPSLLSAVHFQRIFEALQAVFSLQTDVELTLECAPGQLADDTLAELLRHGLNRVSLGVQSFVDQESRAVGRFHTKDVCLAEIARLRSAGVQEINVDLIAGLPHQTHESWRISLEQAAAADVPHVSVYMLEVDEESRLGRELIAGGVRYHAHHVPDDGLVAEMYLEACEFLGNNGIPQYEISNFARPGHASRHNLKYWKRLPYLGLGLDAHSMLGGWRFQNTDDLNAYLEGKAAPDPVVVTPHEALEEEVFLGLRLNEGILLPEDGPVVPVLQQLVREGLMQLQGERIALTPKGRLLSNDVFTELLGAGAFSL